MNLQLNTYAVCEEAMGNDVLYLINPGGLYKLPEAGIEPARTKPSEGF